jgi:hypothetical protein
MRAILEKSFTNAFAGSLKQWDVQFQLLEHEEACHRAMMAGTPKPVLDVESIVVHKPCAGDLRLKQLRELLDRAMLPNKRSPDQVLFHEHFIKLCLPQIYGEDFEPNRMRLMEEFKLTSFKVGTLIMCPRRWGKTWSVASFIACMLIVVLLPGRRILNIATFSSGQRASSSLKSKVLSILTTLAADHRIISNGEELLALATSAVIDSNGELSETKNTIRERGNVNKLWAYPASQKGKWTVCFVTQTVHKTTHNNITNQTRKHDTYQVSECLKWRVASRLYSSNKEQSWAFTTEWQRTKRLSYKLSAVGLLLLQSHWQ